MRHAFAATLLFVSLLVTGCATRVEPLWPPGPAQGQLVELMGQRLLVAREVARTKYRKGIPIQDSAWESHSLRRLVRRGEIMGLSPCSTSHFFRAQFTASTMYQTELISAWQAGYPVSPNRHRSLTGSLRPQLYQIDEEMLRMLALSQGTPRSPNTARLAKRYFQTMGIPTGPALKALSPLR